MFVTGPNVVKTVTHEDVTIEELGGADTHGGTSGVAHFVHDSEPECLQAIRELFGFIPLNNLDEPPRGRPTTRATAATRRCSTSFPTTPTSRTTCTT